MKTDLAIIGGGASGMLAAIAAKRINPSLTVVIYERMDRPGKKILATGNGRCNFTNETVSSSNFHGMNPGFVSHALKNFTVSDTISFFRALGVYPRLENTGKIFPYSGNASSVLDALRLELTRLKVETITDFNTTSISFNKGLFTLTGSKKTHTSSKVIVSTGGRASPNLGSDGSGFDLLKGLGHKLSKLSPAITQIITKGTDVKALQGIKFEGTATALNRGASQETLAGEVLFTSKGLSGPPIFQLSIKVAENICDTISLDIMPELDGESVYNLLIERQKDLSHLTMESFFSGLINKRTGNLIARRSGVDKLSLPVAELSTQIIHRMSVNIKNLTFEVDSVNTWNSAQATYGGILTEDFNPRTMESQIMSNLYATGEVLDICGDCGGFNLQWAWSSGYLAGISAAGYDWSKI